MLWYETYGRDLPWRKTDNPYYIWISEIILQQTRIEQGLGYYARFVETFPTVADLAAASEQQVLKLWQGLGYYSRARNLHEAAKSIVSKHNGQFPDTYTNILQLKGVGKYTAAAIASFAFRLPYPVIDGNVYRVVSRVYGVYTPIGTQSAYKQFENILLRLIDQNRPDIFNQAIMDFGSTYCKTLSPDCVNCIFAEENIFSFFTTSSAYAFMVFNLFCAPCIGAIGAMKRELGGTRKMLKAVLFQTIFAWILATITYQIGSRIENGTFNFLNLLIIAIIVVLIILIFINNQKENEKQCKRYYISIYGYYNHSNVDIGRCFNINGCRRKWCFNKSIYFCSKNKFSISC